MNNPNIELSADDIYDQIAQKKTARFGRFLGAFVSGAVGINIIAGVVNSSEHEIVGGSTTEVIVGMVGAAFVAFGAHNITQAIQETDEIEALRSLVPPELPYDQDVEAGSVADTNEGSET